MIPIPDFCKCGFPECVTTGFEDDFGYWDVCTKCGKRVENGHHFYNHYDGKDHEEFLTPDGDCYFDE